MSWPDVLLTGSGRFRFRLEIEGWPEEFCSDSSITHENGIDGRRMVPGLCSDGIAIGERVVLQEAQLDQDMVNFKLVPAEPKFTSTGQVSDDMLESFTQTVEPVARLGAALAALGAIVGTTLTLDGDDVFDDGTVLHVGTETIRVTSWPSVTRSIWGTTTQHHPLEDDEQSTVTVSRGLYDSYLYPRPTTMEGRRCKLHVYGDGDDGAESGYQVWLGIVARPPYLDRDGVTWRIDAFGITQLFKQKLGANIVETHPIGIYHHATCCLAFQWHFEDELINDGGDPWKLCGFHKSEAEFIDAVNAMLADKLATAPIGIITLDEMFASIKLIKTTDGYFIEMVRTAEDFYDTVDFGLGFASPIIGHSTKEWIRNGVVALTSEGDNITNFAANGIYYSKLIYGDLFDGEDLPSYDGAPISPLGNGAAIMVDQTFQTNTGGGSFEATFHSHDSITTFPPWRVYLDSPIYATGVHISGTAKPGGLYRVLSYDTDEGLFWIDVEPWTQPPEPVYPGAFPTATDHANFVGWLTSNTVIRPVREYGRGSIGDFMTAVIENAVFLANIGDSPFITGDDVGFVLGSYQPISQRQIVRDYRFFSPVAIWDVIREDCKFLNAVPRVSFNGEFQVIPLTRWTERTPVDDDHVLDASCILTPYAGGVGEWPSFEPQTDGRSTSVTIQEDYDAVEGKWSDDPTTFQDSRSISVTKTRGRNPVSIKPYSTPVYASGAVTVAEMKQRIAEIYLAFFSIDYAVCRLQVPFTRFECLIGDVVAITYHNLPDGEGARGVTGRRGIVIQRRVNFDAAIDKMVELTVLLTPRNIVGYAPSGWIDLVATTGSGVTWTLMIDPVDPVNLVMAKGGNVAAHFLVGDRIRVAPAGIGTVSVAIDYELEGVVTSVNTATGAIGVTFDSTWDPADSVYWVLELAKSAGASSAAQKTYAHVSDDDLHLQDGSFSRRFS